MQNAIKAVQSQIGTTADGKWGNASKAALKAAVAKGKSVKISENFSLNELIRSRTALAKNIDNTPDEKTLVNLLNATARLWQPARDLLGAPISVTSGYRSPALNRSIGGAARSAHTAGLAIDFVAPTFGNTRKIAQFLAAQFAQKGIAFDQLILEFPDQANSWIHLGYASLGGAKRGQLLTAVKRRGKTVYLHGLR